MAATAYLSGNLDGLKSCLSDTDLTPHQRALIIILTMPANERTPAQLQVLLDLIEIGILMQDKGDELQTLPNPYPAWLIDIFIRLAAVSDAAVAATT